MKIEIGTLVLLLVELVNLINGYMFDYDGLLDQRRKTRNELLARLYDDLEDNAREVLMTYFVDFIQPYLKKTHNLIN